MKKLPIPNYPKGSCDYHQGKPEYVFFIPYGVPDCHGNLIMPGAIKEGSTKPITIIDHNNPNVIEDIDFEIIEPKQIQNGTSK